MCFCCSWKSGETLSCLLNRAFYQQKQGDFTFYTLLSAFKTLLQDIKFTSVFLWQIRVTTSVVLKEKQCHQNCFEMKQLLVLMLLKIDFLFAISLVIVCWNNFSHLIEESKNLLTYLFPANLMEVIYSSLTSLSILIQYITYLIMFLSASS